MTTDTATTQQKYRFSFLLHHRVTMAQRDLKVIAHDITEAAQMAWQYAPEYIIGDCRHCAIIPNE